MLVRLSALLITSLLHTAALAEGVIRYEVMPNAKDKSIKVVMRIPNVESDTVTVRMPAWAPGAYILGNRGTNIADVSAASADGAALDVTRPDRLTFSIRAGGARDVSVSYRITGADVVEENGKPKRAHISGPRVYMYVDGRKDDPAEVNLSLPPDWKVACSLDPVGGAINRFSAPSYDVLADAPIEMGDYAEDNFEVKGVPHKVVLYGNYAHVDRKELSRICSEVAHYQTTFMGDVPFKRYVFMFRVSGPTGRGAGGLEHLGSTEIGFSGPVGDSVRSVTAHEYFHLWNVKRARPLVLGPFDYTGAVRTNNLWWSEGVTSYYGDLLSKRSGLITEKQYLTHLAQTIATQQANPARLRVSAEESSFKVWDGGGSQGFGQMSYYVKGELIGLCLDLKMRHLTGSAHSLDEVMQYLYLLCGRGNWPGFEEGAIRDAVSKLSGKDLGPFYDSLVRSVAEMPFEECLGYAGLSLAQSTVPEILPNPGLFTRPLPDSKGVRVFMVTDGGSAEKAGLKSDDVIVAVNGKPIATASDAAVFTTLKADSRMKLTVQRDKEKLEIDYMVGRRERRPWTITPKPDATPEQIALRNAWLSGQ